MQCALYKKLLEEIEDGRRITIAFDFAFPFGQRFTIPRRRRFSFPFDQRTLFPKHKRAVCDVQRARFEGLNMPFTTFKENTFNDSN